MEQIPNNDIAYNGFSPSELQDLKSQLMISDDVAQSVEIVTTFLGSRGFGADQEAIKEVLPRVGKENLEELSEEIKHLARPN